MAEAQNISSRGNSKAIKSMLQVTFSNIVTIVSGILVGFLLPKIIGIEDYGYFKTFTLYATYAGLFHLGLSDGIYLKYGGVNYENLEKSNFRLYIKVLFVFELFFSAILLAISFVFLKGPYLFIFVALSIYLVLFNLLNFYKIISQITCRFTELSIATIVQASILIIGILLLFVAHKVYESIISFQYFLLFYVSATAFVVVFYIIKYRCITFGKASPFLSNRREILSLFFTGLPLLIANLCSTLILTIDRQFVNILFDAKTYAIYAFAYNILALVTTATSAVSTVFFPYLKRSSGQENLDNYEHMVTIILIFVSLALILFFPLVPFLNWFLPAYSESLVIFRIIFPGLALSAPITIVMHNYYKALGFNFQYFIKSLVILVVSIAANIVAYFLFKTTIAISIASVISMLIWFVIIDLFFIKRRKKVSYKNYIFLLGVVSLFYVSTIDFFGYYGVLIYFCGFVILIGSCFNKEIKICIEKIKKNRKDKNEKNIETYKGEQNE